jgi:nucleotide-binding universal stress UspA family protein
MFKRILVVARAAQHARETARVAGETARWMEAEHVWLVVCYPAIPGFLGFREAGKAASARLAMAETGAEDLLQAMGVVPGRIQIDFLEGPAAETAIRVAQARHSDLIVMEHGSAGFFGRFRNARLRSLVLARTDCPVLFV